MGKKGGSAVATDSGKYKTFGVPVGKAILDKLACQRSMTKLSDFAPKKDGEVVCLHVLGVRHDHRGPFTPKSTVLIGRVDGKYGQAPVRLACLFGHKRIIEELNGLSL